MKSILIVGDFKSYIHEKSIYSELKKKGYEVKRIKHTYLFIISKFLNRIPILNLLLEKIKIKINEWKVCQSLNSYVPNYIFFYRPRLFSSNFLSKIKNKNKDLKVIIYNNDNAFSKGYENSYWSNFISNCKFADIILSYRVSDMRKYREISKARVIYFPPFVTNLLVKKSNNIKNRDLIESQLITFIGHYEDDGRLEILNYLYENNLDIRVYGPIGGWNRSILTKKIGFQFLPVLKMDYIKYLDYLSNSTIGLCFLSKLNDDVITRRCFEITYMGVCLVSEYNKVLASIFKENEEAIYFRDREELLQKLKMLVGNKDYLRKISLAGARKCHSLGVTVQDRVKTLENKVFQ